MNPTCQGIEGGNWGDPQAHIMTKPYLEPPWTIQGDWLHIGPLIIGCILLLAIAELLLFRPSGLLCWAVGDVSVFMAIESAIWGGFSKFLAAYLDCDSYTLVLVWNFWLELIVLCMIGVVIFLVNGEYREINLTWQS